MFRSIKESERINSLTYGQRLSLVSEIIDSNDLSSFLIDNKFQGGVVSKGDLVRIITMVLFNYDVLKDKDRIKLQSQICSSLLKWVELQIINKFSGEKIDIK